MFQVFGKTMENVRKRVDIRVLRAPEERQAILKRIAQLSFKRFSIFGDGQLDLESEVVDDPAWAIPGIDGDVDPPKSCVVGIHNRKTKVCLSKPVYVGMCVLDLSKFIMFDFYYEHLKALYADSIRMLYTDTDSLIVHVETEDVYADMLLDSDLYDTSNYPSDHPLYWTVNKKVIGKFKDKLGSRIMTEFIGLRSKMYSYTGQTDDRRAKGVNRSVLRNTITHDDYRDCLFDQQVYTRTMPGLRSHQHEIYGETVRKVALSPLDTKRYILEDGITTLAYGHKDIP